MVAGPSGQGSPMTDLATGLGGTASCPSCGAQVTVPDAEGAEVACPKCAAAVPTGPSAAEEGEVTIDEVLRAFGVSGYDTDFTSQVDAVVCGACGTATPAADVTPEELRTVSDELRGGADVVAAALVCPSCGAGGRLLLDSGDDAQRAVADTLAGR